MSIGASGRVVIEIEPALKRELHEVLKAEGTNLKAWFLHNVDQLLTEKNSGSPQATTKSKKTDTRGAK